MGAEEEVARQPDSGNGPPMWWSVAGEASLPASGVREIGMHAAEPRGEAVPQTAHWRLRRPPGQ